MFDITGHFEVKTGNAVKFVGRAEQAHFTHPGPLVSANLYPPVYRPTQRWACAPAGEQPVDALFNIIGGFVVADQHHHPAPSCATRARADWQVQAGPAALG